MKSTTILDTTILDWPWAVAFGLLAAAVGVAAGGPALPIFLLVSALVAAYLVTERQGWLLGSEKSHWVRNSAVASVFSGLVIAFVVLTGGADSPVDCALYLPILLATLCYGLRIGLLTSGGMAAVTGVIVLVSYHAQGIPLPHSLPPRGIAVALSFPLVAIFAGILRAQTEARLRALHTEKQDLSSLLDMSQMMESAFDLDMTLNLLLLNVQQQSDCHVCAVYLTGRDGQTLELRAASGSRDHVSLLPALAVDEARSGDWSVAGSARHDLDVRAFSASRPSRPVGEYAASRLFGIDPDAAAFVCLPLAGVEGLLGMVYIGSHEESGFPPETVARLEQLVARAAFPLQRVLLQQDFRSLAYSDAMTGLDNFRQFEETLGEEMARAERYDRPLSVILLDIDHFKSFNDTLGHQAGDALLGQLGVVLRNSLRNVDKPARYGGEEFVIICPETGRDEVRLIAERIRRAVESTAFALPDKAAHGNAEDARRVTVSLGCATYPGDARSARDLVKKADTALYAAKEAGRNAVRAYEEDGARMAAV